MPVPTLTDLPIRYLEIALSVDRDDFPSCNYLNFASYLRLFAITGLADTYEKILYLDSDIYMARPGLERMFEIDLPLNKGVAAVRDLPQQWNLTERLHEAIELDLPSSPYFNSGVLLVLTREWREQRVFERCLAQIKKYPQALIHTDQSALNLALDGDWAELSWIWNMYCNPGSAWVVKRIPAVLVHFAGGTKPWMEGRNHFPKHIVAWYADFLMTHYQETLAPAPPRPPRNTARKRKWKPKIIRYTRNARLNYDIFMKLRPYRARLRGDMGVLGPRK
ncbi:MAG: glycosyltransferase [Pseudomonadota bacterium]